jgi:LPS-assembly protein
VPVFTGMTSRTLSNLLAVALLLPYAVSVHATGLWDCGTSPGGIWECNGKQPPQPVLPVPEAVTTDILTDPTEDPLVTPEPPDTETTRPEADTGPAEAITVPETAPDPRPETGTQSETTTEPTVPEVPAQPDMAPDTATSAVPVAAPVQSVSRQIDADRWALCPPAPQSTVVTQAADSDTINLQADNAQASDGNVFILEGNAVVQYRQQQLEADRITYRQDENAVTAEGGIEYAGPGLQISGDSATLYPDQDKGSLNQITYALTDVHGRGYAEVINLEDRDNQQLEQASFTTCPPGNKDWILSAKKVDIDQADGTGTARNAKLTFKGVPIMYTPYITFPIDDRRKSGLLIPKYGRSDETGTDISLPYYWNIAPNRDATITPRFMSDRGTMLGGEFRYLNATNTGKIGAEYLPSDDKFNNEDRSLVGIKHTGNPWPRMETSVVASNVSDDRYFEDLGTTLVETSQTNLERTATAAYHGNGWDAGIRVQDFQTIDPAVTSSERPYKQLPSIVLDAAPERRLLGLKVSAHAEANYFSHGDGDLVQGSRIDLQPRISMPIHKAAWYIDPAVSVRSTLYRLHNTAAGEDDNPDRTTPVVSLDAGTFFERNSRWGESDFIQTLEPRLFYLYVPDKNQDDIPVFDTGDYDFNFWTLFRENRFSGPDRMGDANQLAVALTSRFLNPGSGTQLFSASLGSLLYFSDRNVALPGEPEETDDSSSIIGEITLDLARNWHARTEIQWNPHDSQTDRNDYHLQYRAGPRKLVNLAYRYRNDIQEQADISFLWPLGQSWHMVGRWYYSLDENETIEALGGLGYESCCWGAQVVGRSYINDDSDSRNNAVFFQLEMKGLGKLGTKVDDALERGILGYESND